MIVLGILGLFKWGLKFGVDFKGGSLIEYKFEKGISTEGIDKKLEEEGLKLNSIQALGDNKYLLRLASLDKEGKEKLKKVLENLSYSGVEELRFETVGPSIGPELVRKTIYAILIASGVILAWVAYQFKNLKFGISAILAMFHDSFLLIAGYSFLGHFYNVEIDFLFVTALLTTLSFSVHDTIVVFDRIRESQKKFDDRSKKSSNLLKDSFSRLANQAVTETMVRSLNNSFTILFMLTSLILLGGVSIRWFAVALFLGTILGTYSSPFVAVPLLVSWDKVFRKNPSKKSKTG